MFASKRPTGPTRVKVIVPPAKPTPVTEVTAPSVEIRFAVTGVAAIILELRPLTENVVVNGLVYVPSAVIAIVPDNTWFPAPAAAVAAGATSTAIGGTARC
mgnify:CR=1 FL=1